MKKIFLAAFVAAASFVSLGAQSLSYRAEIGGNFSNYSMKTTEYEFSIKPGLRVGGAVEIALSDAGTSSVFLAPGLTYKQNGSIIDLDSSDSDMRHTIHELALPVNIGFRAKFAQDLSVSLELGPYFSYGLSAKSKLGSISTDLYDSEDGALKRFDVGIGGSAALEYTRYYLRIGAEYGFTDMMKNSVSNNYLRNMGFFTTLGIRF